MEQEKTFTVQEFLQASQIFKDILVEESIGKALLPVGWIFIEKKMINPVLRNNPESHQEWNFEKTQDNVMRSMIINLFVRAFGENGHKLQDQSPS